MKRYINENDVVKAVQIILDNADVSEGVMVDFCKAMNEAEKIEKED